MHMGETIASYVLSALIVATVLKVWYTRRTRRAARRRQSQLTSNGLAALAKHVGTRDSDIWLPRPTLNQHDPTNHRKLVNARRSR